MNERVSLIFLKSKESNFMTMAPGRRKRGYWLEIIFISILLFLLWSSLSQNRPRPGARTDLQNVQHSFAGPTLALK
jgi:hypothetical protein